MPTCQNCGSHVSQRYCDVMFGNSQEEPPVCPACDDKVRYGDGAE